MRKGFVEAKTRKKAREICPWAFWLIKVCGGYFCFEGVDDYNVWKKQV